MPTISDLPAAEAVAGAALLVVVQDDTTEQATATQFTEYLRDDSMADVVLGAVGVDTLAALRALSTAGLADGAPALVRGYAALGDGGEGLFRWAEDATGTDNGGTLITPTASAGPGRWRRMLFGEPAMVRHFGAVGDGVTDDTAAINRAMVVGPVVFGSGTFVCNGPLTMPASGSVTWIGVRGATRVIRTAVVTPGASWLTFTLPVRASDIEFDAGSALTTGGGRAVWVNLALTARFERCGFLNSKGSSGSGVVVWGATDRDDQRYEFLDCYAWGNETRGALLSNVTMAMVRGGTYELNGDGSTKGSGVVVSLATLPPSGTNQNQRVTIEGVRAGRQKIGISVGAFDPTGGDPTFDPLVVDALVTGNTLYDCYGYGVSASGYRISVIGNKVTYALGSSATAGAMVLTGTYLTSMGNTAVMPGAFWGIDYGGSYYVTAVGDYVEGMTGVGFNVGSAQYASLADFTVRLSGADAGAHGVEVPGPDSGGGVTYPYITTSVRLRGGRIELAEATQIGVNVTTQASGTVIEGVSFTGSGGVTADRAVVARAQLEGISGCRWNDSDTYEVAPSGASNLLIVPDIYDNVKVTGTSVTVGSVFTSSMNTCYGAITGVEVVTAGTGYTTMTLTASGAGSGATFTPYIWDGGLLGSRIPTPGSGYVPGATTIAVTGDGTGCTVNAVVDAPIPRNKRLRLIADGGFTLSRAGLRQFQYNGGPGDTYVGAQGTIDLVETDGDWRLAGSGVRAAGNILGSSTVAGTATGSIGLSNNVSGRCGLVVGEFCTVTGFRSAALGRYSSDRGATHALARAGNRYAANGDSQERSQNLMGTLTGAGSVRLTCDAATVAGSGANSMPLATSSAFRAHGWLVVKDTLANERCSWVIAEVTGFRASGGTITIDGSTLTKSAFGTGATGTWALSVAADNTTGTLNFTLTNGVGGQTLRAAGMLTIEEVV